MFKKPLVGLWNFENKERAGKTCFAYNQGAGNPKKEPARETVKWDHQEGLKEGFNKMSGGS